MKIMSITITMLLSLLQSAIPIPAAQAPPSALGSSQVPGGDSYQAGLPATGEETLRVFVGRSMVVRVPEPLKRISVTDSTIASAVVVAPDQVMIHGLKAGTVTLLMWDNQERLRTFDLLVLLDLRPIMESIKQVFPNETIAGSQSGSALVLTGEVSSQAVAEKAVALAQPGAPAVANMLRIKAPIHETVMLQVRFAEVDRSAVEQIGINIFSTGGGNTIGATTTQQFGAISGNLGAVPAGVQRGRDPESPSLVSGGIGRTLLGTPAVFGLSDLLNIFIFRPDINVGVIIKALQQKNQLQILAEPNLLATSGQEASFLAGGEFPFPVVQGGTGVTAVTIVFKEFGVRLKFVATLLEDGRMRLKVAPEVSSLDFSNALTVSGFLVPALLTRRADTEVSLRDGQSFAIAGLMDNRLTEFASKVPWLGDVPILGKLFRSRATNRNKTELMVIVTPMVVRPLEPGQMPPLPTFPSPFLDPGKFDGKTGTPPATESKPSQVIKK